ncbi:type IV pilin protein [Pelomonas aquatica]|jgi:type IV pilus assembly protein PilE|nr:type IV pilin protein [Pelomonas aquatica]
MRQITRRSQGRQHHGFTLIEVMVAAVIVAIIAAVAIPQYSQYVVRGRMVEAQGQLAGLGTSLQQYYQDNRSYVGACGNGLAAAPANTTYFTYTCPTLAAASFLVQASGNSGTSVAGLVYTLDQNGSRATPNVPSGWVSSTTCWIRNQSGSCN